MEVTGTSKPTATKYLKKNDYDLNKAIDDYLGKKTYNPAISKIFDMYKESDDVISIDGTLQYLQDLGIEPEDIRSLVLSYFLHSPSMGTFNREDFLTAWESVGVVDLKAMTLYITQLTDSMGNIENFDKLYQFTFDYLIETPHQKTLGCDLLMDYWKLLFTLVDLKESQFRVDQWYEFLVKTEVRSLTKDSYFMFWEFVKEVIIPDPQTLQGYDEMASWPVVIDEFIEYLQESALLSST